MGQNENLKIMLAWSPRSEANIGVERRLRDEGFEIAGMLVLDDNLAVDVVAGKPDVLFVCADAPDARLLSRLGRISEQQICPIVLYTACDDSKVIQAAVSSGVHAIAAGGAREAECHVLIDVARARFNENVSLQRERDQAISKLADRKLVEKAKGIMMKERRLDEDQAHRLMQKMAMDRSVTLADLAAKIIEASMLLK
jgi:response regulator NasT